MVFNSENHFCLLIKNAIVMSKLSWKAAPTMSESYYSRNSIFKCVEDICKEEMLTGATDDKWLQFTTEWTWPGPVTRLIGGPKEINPLVGIRPIPFESIKVDIIEAFKIAEKRLKETNGGNMFIGRIQLYWINYYLEEEPYYCFTTELHNMIKVSAYSGKVEGPLVHNDVTKNQHVSV